MPSVTIILSDTPNGQVAVQHNFMPAVGMPCSPAQSAALDVIIRTRKSYGLPMPITDGVDIDAVHRTRSIPATQPT